MRAGLGAAAGVEGVGGALMRGGVTVGGDCGGGVWLGCGWVTGALASELRGVLNAGADCGWAGRLGCQLLLAAGL